MVLLSTHIERFNVFKKIHIFSQATKSMCFKRLIVIVVVFCLKKNVQIGIFFTELAHMLIQSISLFVFPFCVTFLQSGMESLGFRDVIPNSKFKKIKKK